MTQTKFSLTWDQTFKPDHDELIRREWILTNGLGGYASGTLSGIPTRRYHGFLVSALPSPHGRQVYLNHLSEQVFFPDGSTAFLATGLAALGDMEVKQFQLKEFRMERGLPVWRYELNGYVIERRVLMTHLQNTVYLHYDFISGSDSISLTLRPSVHFRPHEETPESLDLSEVYSVTKTKERYEISAHDTKLPPLRLFLEADKKSFTHDYSQVNLVYREEKNRGYKSEGSLWTPGYFQTFIKQGETVTLIASTELWEAAFALPFKEAYEAELIRRRRLLSLSKVPEQDQIGLQLTLAADSFVISPAGRVQDTARAHAIGEQPRSVIAGYHWFTDWGRDTMISLEGLTLTTRRHREARWILRTFAFYIRRGLIPNLFPEGQREGLYHTTDATLWYFHALSAYVNATGDFELVNSLLPKLIGIIEWHKAGTDFGIEMDKEDHLLHQGQEGYQLTWMDAKVGDWVVTPRRGKAVEVNALWYNALCLMKNWLTTANYSERANEMAALAESVKRSFNRKFWNEETGYLFDVLEGEDGSNDPSCRPNQIFSVSLPNPVLDRERWGKVVDVVQEKLLTPYGLRSLSPDHPDYKSTYNGDLRSRDAAYHQGTVWGWLIGPFVEAWLKVHPGQNEIARRFLSGLVDHLKEAGLGSVSEVFDAEAPYTPRGCIAQAWSVAELNRCWKMTE